MKSRRKPLTQAQKSPYPPKKIFLILFKELAIRKGISSVSTDRGVPIRISRSPDTAHHDSEWFLKHYGFAHNHVPLFDLMQEAVEHRRNVIAAVVTKGIFVQVGL
jgi:hypothetical protein